MIKNNNIDFKKILKEIESKGFVIIKNYLEYRYCVKLKNEIFSLKNELIKNQFFRDEGSSKGQFILRDLVLRNPKVFLEVISNSLILKIIGLIFKDKFILDNIMASDSLKVKDNYSRIVHIDSQLPVKGIDFTTDIVVMICLDNFTELNGATKIWPGSHKSGIRIHHQPNKIKNKINKFKYLKASTGSIAFILGQTWHQVGKNKSNDTRMSIFLHYKRWWMKSSTDFTKCGKKIFKLLNNKQKELFGFNSIPPKFDFKKKIKKVYTLRKISKVSKNYFKSLQY